MSHVGGLGPPVHRLGVQGRYAERAAARCPAESGTVAPVLTSSPVAVLHCCSFPVFRRFIVSCVLNLFFLFLVYAVIGQIASKLGFRCVCAGW